MPTIILFYVIAFMGLVMAGGGVWGFFRLVFGKNKPVLGIAQALRLLVVILINPV